MATGRILPSPSASAYCCARMTASSTARVRTCRSNSVRRFDVSAHSTCETRNPSVFATCCPTQRDSAEKSRNFTSMSDARVMHERELHAVLVPWPVRPGAQLLCRPPRHGAVVAGLQRRDRRLDRIQVTRHPVVHRFHRRSLEGDGGVDRPAFGSLERVESSSHCDLGRHGATVAPAGDQPGSRCQFWR